VTRALDLSGPDRLDGLVGDVATIVTAAPLPTGARIELALGPADGATLAGKVVDTARAATGYRVRIRLFSCPRERREALAALLGPGTPPGST
jgi:hypothetical protein